MSRLLTIAVLLTGMAGAAFATFTAPEIDSNTAGAAIALLAGGLIVLRGRRKK